MVRGSAEFILRSLASQLPNWFMSFPQLSTHSFLCLCVVNYIGRTVLLSILCLKMSYTSEMRRMPVDFFHCLSPWLDGVCIARLFLCGDHLLSALLFSPDSVTEFRVLLRNPPPSVVWPNIVSQLKYLRVLLWACPYSYYAPTIPGATLESFTFRIKVLEIDAKGAGAIFARPDDHSHLADGLSHRFPNLEVLRLYDISSAGWIGRNMDALPHSLRCLHLHALLAGPDFSLQLPNLEELGLLGRSELHKENMLRLPKTLKSLRANGLMQLSLSDLSHLPPHLEHFKAFGTNPHTAIEQQDLRLPPQLQTLSLQLTYFTDGLVELLPPGLKKLQLKVAATSFTKLDGLPVGLTHLEFPSMSSITSDTIKSLPQSITHLDLKSSPMKDEFSELLPRSLASLRIGKGDALTDRFISGLPPNLKQLDLAGINNIGNSASPLLPSGLTTLTIGQCIHTTDEFVSALPRTLTSLCTGVQTEWNDNTMSCLPPSLVTFYALGISKLTDACAPFFPRSLTSLTVPKSYQLSPQFAFLLPDSLTELVTHSKDIAHRYEQLHGRSVKYLLTFRG